jgi:glycosyltransferase EpsD
MKYRPRIINVVHGYLFSENPMYFDEKMKGKLLLLAERFLRRKTDAILTMNEEDLHIATHKKLATGPVIPTFGMGVPAPIYTTEPGSVRNEYSKESEFVLCYVAELSERKNQRFLVAAMPEILLNIPEARLWLVGDGENMKELRDMAEDLGIANRVDFLGKRDNPKDFMRDCDLYVSSSMSEGLPFNVVEALSCGKTVLASRVKGHVDILDDGIGILFRSNIQYDFIRRLKSYYDGEVTVADERIVEGYYNFSEEAVFTDTYNKIKEAGWL